MATLIFNGRENSHVRTQKGTREMYIIYQQRNKYNEFDAFKEVKIYYNIDSIET